MSHDSVILFEKMIHEFYLNRLDLFWCISILSTIVLSLLYILKRLYITQAISGVPPPALVWHPKFDMKKRLCSSLS
jgi:hypothetical protein